MMLSQLAFTYLPIKSTIFRTEPIGVGAWIRSTICAALIFIVVGLEKTWRRHRNEKASLVETSS